LDSARPTFPDLQTLIELFYNDPASLGQFEEVEVSSLPAPYQELLAHHQHMTVAVEAYHHSPVNLKVLETKTTPTHYSRKILLSRQSDGQVVQFGIVRLNFDYLDEEVRREIENQGIPLGRVLINHNVMRQVQLSSLWKIRAGDDLSKLFEIKADQITFGRTALIFCNGEPAVELLEVVIPV